MSAASEPHSGPDAALIQEALEYQEEHSLEGPLFPEAQEELRRLVEQYETLRAAAQQVVDDFDIVMGPIVDALEGSNPALGEAEAATSSPVASGADASPPVPSPDYQLWVNEDRTTLVRLWSESGHAEVAIRENPVETWGPPINCFPEDV